MEIITGVSYTLLFFIEFIIAIYLLVPFVLTGIYLIRKRLRLKSYLQKKPFLTNKEFEFGIIVTAHEETEFIYPLIDSILKQTYGNFYVYIVADACDTNNLNFGDSRVTVLKPEPPLNAKIKSINYGIEHFKKEHDAVIIFDADNLIHPNFLEVMNHYFRKGFRAVQCDFKAKNTDTTFARMDAIGDMFNFFVEREARVELGLSSAIWGSGIAVDLPLYKEVTYMSILGGFDKKLQAHLLQNLPMIAFAKEAILFDEKIESGSSLEKQRTRWINAQFKYFKLYWSLFLQSLKKGNFNLAYCAFINLRPPLFIVFGLAFLFVIINYFINQITAIVWVIIIALFVLSFFMIIGLKSRDRRFLGTLFLMPVFMMRQVFALLKINKANKSFLKTKHTKVVWIDELLEKRPT